MENATESAALPSEWRVRMLRDGMTELVIDESRRFRAAIIVGAAALGFTGYGAWALLRGTAGPTPLVFGMLLMVLALWMLLASESWRVGANLLEHRVGIGRVARISSIRDARLSIVSRVSTLNRVSYHLQAETAAGRRPLFTRNHYDEVAALARFIADRAHWPFEE
jgi:hypothetical protein